MKISYETSTIIGEKFFDLGNLSITALTFGSLLSDKPINSLLFLTGIVIWLILYLFGIILCKRRKND